jgi:hypothetical protein
MMNQRRAQAQNAELLKASAAKENASVAELHRAQAKLVELTELSKSSAAKASTSESALRLARAKLAELAVKSASMKITWDVELRHAQAEHQRAHAENAVLAKAGAAKEKALELRLLVAEAQPSVPWREATDKESTLTTEVHELQAELSNRGASHFDEMASLRSELQHARNELA